ncbi:MAG: hypothetical protein Q7S70_01290 [bacterium]|nr:hypothetical protein [bacterium]
MKLSAFKKIESIKRLQEYNLPIPETIFVFDFKKQEEEIDRFLVNKRIVTIRSDKEGKTDFCPHKLRCLRSEAKKLIKALVSKGFGVIVQRYIPIRRDRASGNILILKKKILLELMGTGPLTWLNRDGLVEERIEVRKNDGREIGHFGKRLITKKALKKILKLVKNTPPYKILEFTLRPEGLYFWQIRDDETTKGLE